MADEPETMSRMQAIRKFFTDGEGKPPSMDELKKLSPKDKDELGDMAIAALGAKLKP